MERLAPQPVALHPREPAFHGVEPRRTRRREVEMPVRVLGEPRPDRLGLVRRTVVQHHVDRPVILPRAHAAVDEPQEGEEFLGAVPLGASSDDFPALQLERRVEVGRSVADVVVRVPLHLAGAQLQQRLGVVEGLYLGLLVDGQHDGPFRRVHVQADDVDDLLREIRVGTEVERRKQVRPEVRLRPDAGDPVAGHAGMAAHEGKRPAGRLRGQGVHRHVQDTPDFIPGDLPRLSGARPVWQAVHSRFEKPLTRGIHGVDMAAEAPGQGVGAGTVHQSENDSRAQGDTLRRGGLAQEGFDCRPLLRRMGKGKSCFHGGERIPHRHILSRINQTEH